jgi:hypothetical protein
MDISRLYDDLSNKISTVASHKKIWSTYMLYLVSSNICDAVAFYKKYWKLNFSHIVPRLIEAQPDLSASLTVAALNLNNQGYTDAALLILEQAAELDSQTPFIQYLVAEILRKDGKLDDSRKQCARILRDFNGFGEAASCMSMCDVDQLLNCQYDYYDLLAYAHVILKPARYIEIGVASGRSLALASADTCSIGVDPLATKPSELFFHSPEVEPLLFPMTSNEFFSSIDLIAILGSPAFNMALIDGHHTFDQVLIDFINLEKLAGNSSVIFIHDCLPASPLHADRDRKTLLWCGDVWRIIPCLKELRPDLDVVTFPVVPTGLAMVTGLNPSSTILSEEFDEILARFHNVPLPESYIERCLLQNVSHEDPRKVLGERLLSCGYKK